MATDQPTKRILWVVTGEKQEKVQPFLAPFGEEWKITVLNTVEALSSALISASARHSLQSPFLLIWGGDISDPILTNRREDMGLEELHEAMSLMNHDHLNILPFYPEGQEEKNRRVAGLKEELDEVLSNLHIIDVLGDRPRQAIQVPANMEKLEIALGLRLGIGIEGSPATITLRDRK